MEKVGSKQNWSKCCQTTMWPLGKDNHILEEGFPQPKLIKRTQVLKYISLAIALDLRCWVILLSYDINHINNLCLNRSLIKKSFQKGL